MKRFAAFALALTLSATTAAGGELDARGGGYLLGRAHGFLPDPTAHLHPTLPVDPLQTFFELGGDGRVNAGEAFTLRADGALLWRPLPSGCRVGGPQLCLIINELNLEYRPTDAVRLLVGRHRLTWGPGLMAHAIEPLNPAPDPTDPSSQRLGSWLAMAEAAFDPWLISLVYAPEIAHSSIGLPVALNPWGTLAARVGFRPEGFDVNGVYFFDLQRFRSSAGGSVSATPLDRLETHAELLVHVHRPINTGTLERGSCSAIRSVGIPYRGVWDFSAVVGGRYELGQDSFVALEYHHNADGMTNADFETVLNTVSLIQVQCPNARIERTDLAEEGRPQQFATLFLKRNYLLGLYSRPRLAEEGFAADTGASLSVIAGLEDASFAVSGRLTQVFADRYTVRLGVLGRFGGPRGQYTVLPFFGSALLDVTASF